MTTLANDLVGTRIPKLEEERFALVVLGEFNHGKSTFVNALCGAAILPGGHHADDGDDQPPGVGGEAARDGAPHRRHDARRSTRRSSATG